MRTHALLGLSALVALTLGASDPSGPMVLEGLIEPSQVLALGFPVEGRLAAVHVERGDRVQRGQVLATLECEVEQASLAIAQARAGATAELDMARVRVEHLRRRVEAHRKLLHDGVLTADEFFELETNLRLAELDHVRLQEAQRIAALEVERLHALLAQRRLVSPADAVIVERTLGPGEQVLPARNDSVLRLAVVDPLLVEAYAPAAWRHRLRAGQVARIEPEDGGPAQPAVVKIVDPVVHGASATVGVRLEIAQPAATLVAGLRCTIRFEE